jgi:hypothetical protein
MMIYKLIAGAFVLLTVATASAIGGAAFVINGIGNDLPDQRVTVPMSAFHTDNLQAALDQAQVLSEGLEVPVDVQLPPTTYTPADTIELRSNTGLLGARTPRDLALWMTYMRLANLAQCQTEWRTNDDKDLDLGETPACPGAVSKFAYRLLGALIPIQLPRTTIDVHHEGPGIEALNVSHVRIESLSIQGP